MSVQRALLVEVFALLLVVYGAAGLATPEMYGSVAWLHAGVLVGALGLAYGLVGDRVVAATGR